MKRKHESLMNHLERYFSTYLPMGKGLSQSTIDSYKNNF